MVQEKETNCGPWLEMRSFRLQDWPEKRAPRRDGDLSRPGASWDLVRTSEKPGRSRPWNSHRREQARLLDLSAR
jgi:hypothetical protein